MGKEIVFLVTISLSVITEIVAKTNSLMSVSSLLCYLLFLSSASKQRAQYSLLLAQQLRGQKSPKCSTYLITEAETVPLKLYNLRKKEEKKIAEEGARADRQAEYTKVMGATDQKFPWIL